MHEPDGTSPMAAPSLMIDLSVSADVRGQTGQWYWGSETERKRAYGKRRGLQGGGGGPYRTSLPWKKVFHPSFGLPELELQAHLTLCPLSTLHPLLPYTSGRPNEILAK